MRGIVFISISLTLLLFLSSFPSVSSDEKRTEDFFSSANFGKGYRYNVQGWIYLHIEGEPYERGYQHGHLLAIETEQTDGSFVLRFAHPAVVVGKWTTLCTLILLGGWLIGRRGVVLLRRRPD